MQFIHLIQSNNCPRTTLERLRTCQESWLSSWKLVKVLTSVAGNRTQTQQRLTLSVPLCCHFAISLSGYADSGSEVTSQCSTQSKMKQKSAMGFSCSVSVHQRFRSAALKKVPYQHFLVRSTPGMLGKKNPSLC